MIVGVFGLPGAGKTTFLTKCAYKWTHGKKFMGIPPADIVLTNFDCPNCYKLDFDSLGKFNFHHMNILIDEIMLFADCRNFKTFSEDLKAFFALHRRSHVNVVWCSQSYRDCDIKIRNLTEKFFLLECGKILSMFSFAKPIYHVMNVKSDEIQDRYILGAPLEWVPVFRPRYYSMFDSYESKLKLLPDPELIPWQQPNYQK